MAGLSIQKELALDFDIDAAWEVEAHERVDRFVGRFEYIDQSIVSSEFEVLHRLFIDVRSADNAEPFDIGGKRNGARNAGAGSLGGLHDLFGRCVNDAVIKRSKADSYFHHDVILQPEFR